MKKIFFITPCQYTKLGFGKIIETISDYSVDIVTVSEPEEIIEHAGHHITSVIVIDLAHCENSVLASSLWFLWNLSVLYSEGRIPAEIPCILLGDKYSLSDAKYPFIWISPRQSANNLRMFFMKVLTTPECYMREMYGFTHFSDKERFVINQHLNGLSAFQIARRMQTTYKDVVTSRQKAMKKIGLRNRNEVILLMGKKFL